jgi:putative inorganic carbon (hco3(-)) transporter
MRERLTALLGPLPSRRRVADGVLMLVVVYVALKLAPFPLYPVAWFTFLASAAIAAAIAYVLWYSDPVWLASAAVALSVFSGSWELIGLPSRIVPDRLLLVAAIAVVALRGPAMRDRPRLRLGFVHLVLAAAAVYAVGSALAAGTLLEGAAPFRLLDRFTLLGFAAYVVAPVIFSDERKRNVLLGVLVALGLYLGLIALFETLELRSLIFPSYIADPGVGIHFGRARGPFLESAGAASGLFACAVAAAIAVVKWQTRWPRVIAAVTLVLCVAGQLFTLLRSAWIGTALAVVVTMLLFHQLRRYVLPVAIAGALTIALALVAVPGLADRANERKNSRQPEWDRRAQYDVAINMFEARPLVGFGWATYSHHSADFTRLRADYPFYISQAGIQTVHNVLLANLAELGLLGTTLWLLGLIIAVGGAITRRGPPELLPWRIGLLAIAIHFAVLMAFTQLPAVFPNLLIFVWAGVVSAGAGAWRPARDIAPRLAPAPA